MTGEDLIKKRNEDQTRINRERMDKIISDFSIKEILARNDSYKVENFKYLNSFGFHLMHLFEVNTINKKTFVLMIAEDMYNNIQYYLLLNDEDLQLHVGLNYNNLKDVDNEGTYSFNDDIEKYIFDTDSSKYIEIKNKIIEHS
ncbi:MAG: hypothetical protein RR548_04905 [Carnobacterium sp.]|uniref:hypothetical protein n=1 Tax=Carnobacterium sp. TaxID=48221 RepID=UPI002FC60C64